MGETPAIPDGVPRHNAQQQGEQRRRQGIHTAGFIRRIIVSRFLGEKTPCVPHQSGQAVGQLFPAQQTGQKRRSRTGPKPSIAARRAPRTAESPPPQLAQTDRLPGRAPVQRRQSPQSQKHRNHRKEQGQSLGKRISLPPPPHCKPQHGFFRFQLSLNSNSNFSGLPQPSPV